MKYIHPDGWRMTNGFVEPSLDGSFLSAMDVYRFIRERSLISEEYKSIYLSLPFLREDNESVQMRYGIYLEGKRLRGCTLRALARLSLRNPLLMKLLLEYQRRLK